MSARNGRFNERTTERRKRRLGSTEIYTGETKDETVSQTAVVLRVIYPSAGRYSTSSALWRATVRSARHGWPYYSPSGRRQSTSRAAASPGKGVTGDHCHPSHLARIFTPLARFRSGYRRTYQDTKALKQYIKTLH